MENTEDTVDITIAYTDGLKPENEEELILRRKTFVHALRNTPEEKQIRGNLTNGEHDAFCAIGLAREQIDSNWTKFVDPLAPDGMDQAYWTVRQYYHISGVLETRIFEMNDAGGSFVEIANFLELWGW